MQRFLKGLWSRLLNRNYGSKSLRELENLYDKVYKDLVKVENAIRIKLPCAGKPRLSQLLASRFQESLDSLQGCGSVLTAERLLRALPGNLLDRYHVEVRDHGANPYVIQVSLGAGDRKVMWLVYPSRLDWPGIHVIALITSVSPRSEGLLSESKTFCVAQSLVQYTIDKLEEETRG